MANAGCKYLSLLVCLLALAGCAATDKNPPNSNDLALQRNEGYGLLYKLIGDESKVGQIFALKSAQPPIRDLITQIGAYCQSAKTQLDAFAKADPQLAFTITGLPAVEQKSRDLEASAQTKALLFTSGPEFERRLLFTQAQAMGYATQLSAALSEKETDTARKDFLTTLSHRCSEFRDQLMGHLAVHS